MLAGWGAGEKKQSSYDGHQALAAAVIMKALEDFVSPRTEQDSNSAKAFLLPGSVDLEFWCGIARISSGEILRAVREGLITKSKLKSISMQLCYSPVAERFRGADEDEAGDSNSSL